VTPSLNRIVLYPTGNNGSQKRRKLGQAAHKQKFCERLAKAINYENHESFSFNFALQTSTSQ
jgi:nicotinic acid mononucleotide adenylyltransferase